MKVTTKKILERMGWQLIEVLIFILIIAGLVAGVIFCPITTFSILAGMVLITLIYMWYCAAKDEIEIEESKKKIKDILN